ncbi:MAG: hypothetical protein ACR2NN_26205 [Bryobacteraceae bacterium]
MERLLQSPYMRSYWIQRNASELKHYNAAISDTRRTGTEIGESRVLLRRKIFEPRAEAASNDKTAPMATSMDAAVGSESDLEVRIDQPPLDSTSAQEPVPRLLDGVKLDGMMQVEQTRVLPDGAFVGIDSAVVLLADAAWNTALSSVTSGLSPIQVRVNGKILVAANRPELAAAILGRIANSSQQPARYATRYGHATELPHFIRMMRLIDNPLKAEGPSFFSGNLASLGRALGRLDSASITVHDTGAVVSQDVVYRWKQ